MLKSLRDKLSKHLFLQYIVVSVVSWIVFATVEFTISTAMSRWVFDSELFSQFWEKQYYSTLLDFQSYITDNNLTVGEAYECIPYDGGKANVELYSHSSHMKRDSRRIEEELICSDGTFCLNAYTPSQVYWKRWNFIGTALAFVLSEMVVLIYVYRQVIRMRNLYNQIIATEPGKRDLVIGIDGVDELAKLGQKVESMRERLIKSLDDEITQREKQTQLIASLSHDIRTPLTKIIAYLDILNFELAKTEQEKANCIAMITEKANQLRSLTDSLLNSISQGDEYQLYHRKYYDGASALSQMLFECSCDLEETGFKVYLCDKVSETFQLNIDIVAIKRVFDNVFSNLQKYADIHYPIKMWTEENEQEIAINIENRKSSVPCGQEDSHGLGLITVRQIMKAMDGQAFVESTADCFRMCLILPKTWR